MDHPNPYAPPKAPVADVVEVFDGAELATRWQRLGASLLDTLVALVWSIPLGLGFGIWTAIYRHQPVPATKTLLVGLLSVVIFMLVNGNLLRTQGQTLGKRWVGIRIVTLDNKLPEFWRLVALRCAPVWLMPQIPFIGKILSVVDDLMIFGESRRCLHDLIAGTKVVRA
jgi:uncharacterized RDD family membrane protein YckC